MKKITLACVLAISCLCAAAQLNPVKPLTIGDTVPATLRNLPLQVVNHSENKNTITLADYKNKLIILDFWATSCGACIRAMPRIHKLHESFQKDMVVLPVTEEGSGRIDSFLKTNSVLKQLNMLSVVSDTVLKEYFPHRYIPHYIWLSPKGRYLGATNPDALNPANIKSALAENANGIAGKVDLDAEKPMFLDGNIVLDSNSFYSILYKGQYIGLPSGNRFRMAGDILRGRAVTNDELLPLYEAAVGPLFEQAGLKYNRKLLVLKVKDTAAVYIPFTNNSNEIRDFYNYDLIVPVMRADSLFSYMLQDLNRYTGYQGSIRVQQISCFIIKKNGPAVNKPSTGISIENAVKIINQSDAITLPVVNSSGFKGKLDISLTEPLNMSLIKKQLESYGFKIVVEKRPMRVFVLADKHVQ